MVNRNPVKSWFFTLNNPSEEETNALVDDLKGLARCATVGKEVGESGTPHLQGCFVLRDAMKLKDLKNKLNERAHWEPMKNVKKSREYCKKEGNVILDFGYPEANIDINKLKLL
ncbi:hypothetical protein P9112_009940 [Eukaryota sp. TZLM1-RC]